MDGDEYYTGLTTFLHGYHVYAFDILLPIAEQDAVIATMNDYLDKLETFESNLVPVTWPNAGGEDEPDKSDKPNKPEVTGSSDYVPQEDFEKVGEDVIGMEDYSFVKESDFLGGYNFLYVLENKTAYTVDIEIEYRTTKADGEQDEVKNSWFEAVAPGEKVVWDLLAMDAKDGSMELSVCRNDERESLRHLMSADYRIGDDDILYVKLKNGSDKDLYLPIVNVLMFKGDEVVYNTEVYVSNDEDLVPAGETVEDGEYYFGEVEPDRVEFYFSESEFTDAKD